MIICVQVSLPSTKHKCKLENIITISTLTGWPTGPISSRIQDQNLKQHGPLLSALISHSRFQRFLNTIFADLLGVFIIIYLDDILIFSLSEEDHVKHVSEVLCRLQEHNLFANGKKCVLHMDSVKYLGHIIGPGGLWMDPGKVKIIQDWPEPKKVKDIQYFLSFAIFFRWYIHSYSDIVVPLTCLTRKNTPWDFLDKCHLVFSLLKNSFTTALVLTQWRPIIVETDASDYALAAILSVQEPNGDVHPIAFLPGLSLQWSSTMMFTTRNFWQF